MPEVLSEDAVQVPIVDEADVVVVGGSLAGFAAAARARESGLNAILLEERGSLGREAWASLQVFPRNADAAPALGQEIRERLRAVEAWGEQCFDAPALQILLDRIAQERGVRVLLQTWGESVVSEAGALAVVIGNKSGRQALRCRHVVDATETARMLVSAGVMMADAPTEPVRRAMLMTGVAVEAETVTFGVPESLGVVGNEARIRRGHWPGDGFVWADLAGIDLDGDGMDRETLRRMMALAQVAHESVPGMGEAALMFVAQDALWLRGKALVGPVAEAQGLHLSREDGSTVAVAMPADWIDPGSVVGCGPWLNAPQLSAADYADFGNALTLGDACAQNLH